MPEHEDAQIQFHAKIINEHDLEFLIQDNGVGATDEVCQHIFEPFFTTQLGQGNSGLGMHVVYTLVQRLNGDIEVSSPDNHGLCVRMHFKDCVVPE